MLLETLHLLILRVLPTPFFFFTQNIGANYRKDRKTLMICSLHFDLEDVDLVRLSDEETQRISDQWGAGGSFHGRLYTTDLLPTKFVNKADNANLIRGGYSYVEEKRAASAMNDGTEQVSFQLLISSWLPRSKHPLIFRGTLWLCNALPTT